MSNPMTLKKILSYRSFFMGIAIFWVVMHHCSFDFPGHFLTAIKETADCSIDIFMICSGLGCFYSFRKDRNLANFYKRRTLKLMSVYWVFILIWILWKYLTFGISFASAVGNFFAFEYIINPDGAYNWYITGIWVMYILAPFLIMWVEKHPDIKSTLFIIVLLGVISFPIWKYTPYLSIIFNRIPSFFFGIYLANLSDDYVVKKKDFAILIALMLLGMAMAYYANYMVYYRDSSFSFRWYQFSLITPGLCLIVAYVLRFIEKNSIGQSIIGVFSYIGRYTLPIYLTHLVLFSMRFIDAVDKRSYVLLWIIRIISIIPASLILIRLGKENERLLRKLPLFRKR